MFGDVSRTGYDLSFRLLGIPVRIHPLFWVVAILFSPFLSQMEDMKLWFSGLAGWVAAWLATFLVHELGHALVLKKIFGADPWIVLYGFGGAAIHQPYYRRRPGGGGRMLISFAGPGAELAAIGIVLTLFWLSGSPIEFHLDQIGPLPIPLAIPNRVIDMVHSTQPVQYFAGWFLFAFIWMGLFWGILNLLPIQPLDGGHLTREFFRSVNPRSGVRLSLFVSLSFALLMAVFCFMERNFFIALFFGFFAMTNYRELQSRPF